MAYGVSSSPHLLTGFETCREVTGRHSPAHHLCKVRHTMPAPTAIYRFSELDITRSSTAPEFDPDIAGTGPVTSRPCSSFLFQVRTGSQPPYVERGPSTSNRPHPPLLTSPQPSGSRSRPRPAPVRRLQTSPHSFLTRPSQLLGSLLPPPQLNLVLTAIKIYHNDNDPIGPPPPSRLTRSAPCQAAHPLEG